ncbi:MAG: protease inhibitor I42 family protein [Okeania sp. SIO3B5]|uniref:protease inhibitor I42 family protein n=1 Tax=Okeania sp. SIO3B5 TaxID=2607811 RepID=UPI0013FFD992|nr:protease inhibitor I42 family protein [Okeania sp. SIO3B5]NEO58307.1 protease inhibitor I42 family protein [Okeania sp. SIO3B5]
MLLSLKIERKQIYTILTIVVFMIILHNYSDFVSSFFADASEVSTQDSCSSTVGSTKIISVSDENNSEAVTLKQNHLLMVQLASNPGTGYGWQLVQNNPEQLKLLENPTLEPPNQSIQNDSVYQVFRFQVQSGASSILELQYPQEQGTNNLSTKSYRLNILMSNSSATITATDFDNNQEIRVAKDDIFVVRLRTNPASGYSWQIVSNNPNQLKLLDNSISGDGNQTAPGGSAYQVFRFQVASEGTSVLELQYRRPEETTPKETYRIGVQILEQTEVVRLTESDNNKEVRLIPGNTLIVRLDANPDSGQSWQVIQNDANKLKPLGSPVLQQTGTQYKNFCFQAQSAGTSTLEFHYSRPWERNQPPLNIYRLNVKIP